jgi:hypothetical protein
MGVKKAPYLHPKRVFSHWVSGTYYPGADLQGGWRAPTPLQLVHQWKYGEGEGEEKVKERRKMERKRGRRRD